MKLTVYFTSDTHGYLYPTSFLDEAPRPMGLFSMTFPKDGNTLVIDGGDSLQGSPLTYYCNEKGIPTPVSNAMNRLKCDYVTLGNHDFNYGRRALADYLKALDAACLCANVTDETCDLPILPHAVRVMENGLRVGLVGVVTSWITLWEKPENLEGFAISDPFEAARRSVLALRDQVDMLIGIYHGGFEKDLETGKLLSATDENIACRLCETLPFDLLLTGHQHAAIAGKTYHNTHVVQTPANAIAYAVVTLDDEGRFDSRLVAPEIPAALEPWQQELFRQLSGWLDTPIGHLSRALRPGDKLDMALRGSPIADFFNMVQLAASGADISATALGNDVRGFEKNVTVRDVVSSYVYSNTLVVLKITGAALREALEQCARYFHVDENGDVSIAESFLRPKAAHYNYDYFMGVEYAFDPSRPEGSRVSRLERNGRSVTDGDEFLLVTNNYRATGTGNFDSYKGLPRVKEILTEVSELILGYLGSRGVVEIPKEACFSVAMPQRPAHACIRADAP